MATVSAITDSAEPRIGYHYSDTFLELLRHLGCTLLVTTYERGDLIAIGSDADGVQLSFHEFDRATGVAARDSVVAVASARAIWHMADYAQLAPLVGQTGRHDRLYMPRSTVVTGSIGCHELAWGTNRDGENELWIVNTRFSSLCTPSAEYSFIPRWTPPFISQITNDDRCHLNGLAMREGRPAYVTVLAASDSSAGWRDADLMTSGRMLDVATGEVISTGLALPHSPRWHADGLLVLNSGLGTLERAEVDSGRREVVAASLPGFPRGLAVHGNLAFVGFSRTRADGVVSVSASEQDEHPGAGIAVIDLLFGTTVATFDFEAGVDELFDVQILSETRCASVGDWSADAGDSAEVWVMPQPGPPSLPLSDRQIGELVGRAHAAQSGGRPVEAVRLLQHACQAAPFSADLANRLGNAFLDCRDNDAAMDSYRRALELDQNFPPALQNLGSMELNRGETGQGLARLERSQEIDPADRTRLQIATALPVIHRDEADLACWRERLEREVGDLADGGMRLDTAEGPVPTIFYAAYHGLNDRDIQANLGRIYQGADVSKPRERNGERPRIGFLSAFFHFHTIGHLNLGRVQHLDRERFEVVVLTTAKQDQPFAQEFANAADRFVQLPTSFIEARDAIAAEQLDVLFFADVGMDVVLSALAFSRMAPVQCVTWGHPVTTGSPMMDHFLSSSLLEVPEADSHYTERLARRPTLGTYRHRPVRPNISDARGRLGFVPGEHVYACPQSLFKFHPEFDPMLGEILRRDPKGVLVLQHGMSPVWHGLLLDRFERSIPDVVDRIRWLPGLSHDMYLALLAESEVTLDPIHFGGGNTTYEMLSLGTPVVTLPGQFLRSRISRALYTKAGYDNLIVADAEEYVEKAVALGTDPAYRREVSAEILERCDVLYDDLGEIRDLEDFFESIVL